MSLLGSNAEAGIVGDLVLFLPYPVYALSVAMPKSAEWRVGVLLILLVVHGCAVAAAMQMAGSEAAGVDDE